MSAAVDASSGLPRHAQLPPRVSPVPPEGRPYQGHRAGVVSRTVANSVDFVVVALVVAVGYGGISAVLFLWSPSDFAFPSVRGTVLLALAGLVMGTYLTLSWFTTGRTYGDHLFGLRVVDHRGERLSLLAAAARAGMCVLLPIGLLWVAVSRSNRSVQDVLLRTSVVYDWAGTARPETPPVPDQRQP